MKELVHPAGPILFGLSHPTRVRGLKERIVAFDGDVRESHPTRVRGLKEFDEMLQSWDCTSHPTRVRGLKDP